MGQTAGDEQHQRIWQAKIAAIDEQIVEATAALHEIYGATSIGPHDVLSYALYPKVFTKLEMARTWLGRYGCTAKQQEMPMKQLSDAQKARIVFPK